MLWDRRKVVQSAAGTDDVTGCMSEIGCDLLKEWLCILLHRFPKTATTVCMTILFIKGKTERGWKNYVVPGNMFGMYLCKRMQKLTMIGKVQYFLMSSMHTEFVLGQVKIGDKEYLLI